jgi:WD40 repeat protein/transcriptional regulator with XRE-family HTH domain
VPPSDDPTGESFRGLILQLRGRTGLTQRELAARIGVNVSSIQGWEAGDNYPGVASLKAIIATGLQTGGFVVGREREEAQALWTAALRDAPRFRTPFDGTWFEQITDGRRSPVQGDAERAVAASPAPPATTTGIRRESWGEAPDVVSFVGRASERALLKQWVLDEGSRVVVLLGLGGIGKSLLATRLAHDLAPSFERVFWRGLRDAPAPGEWLGEAIGFLAPNDPSPAQAESVQVRRLLELLSEARCLLVLDNFETVLQPGGRAGDYRPGYERYGTLLRQLGEAPHQSCLVVTSREEPLEIGPLRGAHGPVRALDLGGLVVEDGQALLRDKRLEGDEAAWQALVRRYGGNSLALKVVGETTRELFGGSIAEYLEYATATSGVMVGGVGQLLGAQIQRLSDLEMDLLRRLAVAREPVGLAELAADLSLRIGRGATLEAVEGLRRRSLLERAERGPFFGLHSVVQEYVTEQLIQDVADELAVGAPDRLLRQPLLKATGKDHVRRSQERLILTPVVERLVETCGSARAAERRLMDLLDAQRGQPAEDQGYGPGNVVNLLRLLREDLKGVDLSGLAIRQVYLQDVEAQGASLTDAHLAETVLGEGFSYPNAVALSAHGTYLAAGTASGEVCCWRIADRTLLVTLLGHADGVLAVALSDDGRLVVSGGVDGTVRLWEAEGGRPLATLHGHSGDVHAVALSGDGRLAASGGADGTVRLWAAERGQPLAILDGHTSAVYSVALSGDGRIVASGSLDGTIRLWEVVGARPVATLRGHTGGVWGVALSGDGGRVASGGIDGTVRLWDVAGERVVATLQGHGGLIFGVALSRDGRLAISCSFDTTVRLWEAEDALPRATLRGHAGGVCGVALSGDGRLVASGSFDGTVRLWEVESGLPLASLRGHTGGVRGVALSGGGQLVAGGSFDGAVRVWESASGELLTTLRGHDGGVHGVALSVDGRLVASGGVDATVRLWEARTGQPLATLRGHTSTVRGVMLSGDGLLVASGSFDGTIRLWETTHGRPLAVLQGHTGGVMAVALTGDGRLVASGSLDGTVRLWDTGTRRPLIALEGHDGGVLAVALSWDGRLVASGSYDGTVRLWEATDGRPLATLHGHAGGIWGVALSGDGRLVASSGYDGTVRLWAADSDQPLAILRGHVGLVLGVTLSADGQLVASSGVDGTVRLWDVPGGSLRRTLRAERRYHGLDITGLAGITDAQRRTLLTLGAVERRDSTGPPT